MREKETILYGLPKGATERHEEVLLLTNATPKSIERVKVLATGDGFHSFRLAEIDLSTPPDFSGKSENERTENMNATITEGQKASVSAYIRRIRNGAKKLYAQRYFLYLSGQGVGEPERGAVSYMAAQAVRMQISQILNRMGVE